MNVAQFQRMRRFGSEEMMVKDGFVLEPAKTAEVLRSLVSNHQLCTGLYLSKKTE